MVAGLFFLLFLMKTAEREDDARLYFFIKKNWVLFWSVVHLKKYKEPSIPFISLIFASPCLTKCSHTIFFFFIFLNLVVNFIFALFNYFFLHNYLLIMMSDFV